VKILLLGSTGSIGTSALNCVRRFPDTFTIVGLAARKNAQLLKSQIQEFCPLSVCATLPETADAVTGVLPAGAALFTSEQGLVDIVEKTEYDVLLNALVGAAGFAPTVAALRMGKRVALANKESLVIGGDYIKELLDKYSGSIAPIDSEHSAILQCLSGEDSSAIERLILTASGGPFRNIPKESFGDITPAQALKHPTWAMGPKITIDSATLMNKGFEIIEAHHLFKVDYTNIDVVIHPRSIVHSMVVFKDGAVMAQCGLPDMELPIQYALTYPKRLPIQGPRLDLTSIGTLEFLPPDYQKFPCLSLCIEAGKAKGIMPAALNAANEVAVAAFLNNALPFNQIPVIIEKVLSGTPNQSADSFDAITSADASARTLAHTFINA
jgi:1-deoxy-D-xylulose-5-phosphate reductoisomerase